ncbi:phospholipase A2 group V-like [Phascolarctos cinereus]|nr:calcium-dependent phospholipase A2-like isoform X2 [Phascolarctos cinereus]XP_020828850.1 calcium-dependent phospholipase A2-like isoform X2 [Phascolarctos cinereus]XP_020828852.1 calcium-dependent phospholipase A2-like isoform X2 [Phascolarctos cinereus]
MKTIFLLAVLMACGLPEVRGGLKELNSMIGKLTGKKALTDYGFYGCHCGWGGKGTPKDATDRCCLAHDCCYSKLVKKGCKLKTQAYNFKYKSGSITCGSGNYCQKQLCACDRTVAYCMKKNQKSYKVKYRNYPNFLCKGNKPKC